MITNAAVSDREELVNIWKACFSDNDEFINLFLDAYDFDNALVYRKKENAVSALYMIRMNCGRAVYFYALGTLPDYRNKGIMGELIRKALDICKCEGADYAFLIPAEEGLVNYYDRFGFSEKAGLSLREACDGLIPDNNGIREFVEKEEKEENAESAAELYGSGIALICRLNGETPRKISGFIPF